MNPLIILFSSFIITFMLGLPIAISLGLSSIITMFYAGIPIVTFAQNIYRGLDSFPLLAVPFFLLTANLMNEGMITNELIKLSRSLVGHIRGSLAIVNVIVSMVFAGLSGSSVADTAGIGGVLIPAMVKEGYDTNFTVAITVASSTIGVIIPPSIFMIIFGAYGGVSIAALFLGGAIPGILIGVTQIIYCYFVSKKRDYPIGEKSSILEMMRCLKSTIWALFVPVLIIGGIVWGIFTATEAAAVAVVYILFLNIFIYRHLTLKLFFESLESTVNFIGPPLFAMVNATIFGWLLAYFELPKQIIDFCSSLSINPTIILLLISLLYLVLGTFMSGIASIIIFLPVVMPLAKSVGINPVHLGVIITMTLALGLLTPPYGLCLLLGAKIGKIKVTEAFNSVLIFIFLFLLVILLVIFFPELVLFLPRKLLPYPV
ncbi:MAG: TRAP transporter large permease [Atribacterota bacterium]|nr:TRAP transporter large permease [Atribacterota bacterium]